MSNLSVVYDFTERIGPDKVVGVIGNKVRTEDTKTGEVGAWHEMSVGPQVISATVNNEERAFVFTMSDGTRKMAQQAKDDLFIFTIYDIEPVEFND